MNRVKIRPEYPVLSVRFLILIYALLCVLTLLFSKSFYVDTLQKGNVPDSLHLFVFFTIPIALMIVLGFSFFNLVMDFIFKRPGSRFNARLLGYFAVIVIFSITPIVLMTSTALNEIVRFWHNLDPSTAATSANSFAADNYSMHLERFENIIRQTNFSRADRMPNNIASVQVFTFTNNQNSEEGTAEAWVESSFTGNERFKLSYPPSAETGFTSREMPRDTDTIRYTQKISRNQVRVISYNLGDNFDLGREALKNQAEQFEVVNELRKNMRPLLFYYYVVFFLPTLLMTALIAISFTRRITRPIVELTSATQRVAEGDFSFQILTRRNDELGILIRSFNSMIQDLEKSREALVRSEKISVWQNMAQQLAHEIKNPLTPIKLSAERVLRRWQNNPEEIGEIIESSMLAIIQETEGLSTLLNEFRTLSKPMESSKSITNIRNPVEEVINSYSSSYPNVNFNIEHVQEDIYIKIDNHRISQILANLVINAIDSMDGKGLIEIRTDLVKKREVCYCRISVKDNGKGISAEETQHIFTPYFTTKASGTGLGLPIIERIVTDHSGSIWFDSSPGIGSTFYIDLPFENNSEENDAGNTNNR
jgi:nitrogen fixation/metabolism regulation signal transduction histidine kinase